MSGEKQKGQVVPKDTELASDLETLCDLFASSGGFIRTARFHNEGGEPYGVLFVEIEGVGHEQGVAVLEESREFVDSLNDLVMKSTFSFEEETESLQEEHLVEAEFPASIDGGLVYL